MPSGLWFWNDHIPGMVSIQGLVDEESDEKCAIKWFMGFQADSMPGWQIKYLFLHSTTSAVFEFDEGLQLQFSCFFHNDCMRIIIL